MDRLPIPVALVVSQKRDCASCNWSWNLLPNGKEMRRGCYESVTCCLHVEARIKLTDGTYPRLTSLCRADKQLCSGGGKWWTLIVEPIQVDYRPQHTPGFYRQKTANYPSRPPRPPYKIKPT